MDDLKIKEALNQISLKAYQREEKDKLKKSNDKYVFISIDNNDNAYLNLLKTKYGLSKSQVIRSAIELFIERIGKFEK